MEKIEIKTTITLKELVDQIRIDLPHKPHVTHQAASKTLDGRMYTIKDLRPVPAQWNTPERIDERVEFANYLMGDGLHVHKIFIDEFGFNVWTSRSKGRALRGQCAVRIVGGQREECDCLFGHKPCIGSGSLVNHRRRNEAGIVCWLYYGIGGAAAL